MWLYLQASENVACEASKDHVIKYCCIKYMMLLFVYLRLIKVVCDDSWLLPWKQVSFVKRYSNHLQIIC